MTNRLVTYLVLLVFVAGFGVEDVLGQGEERRGSAGATYLLLPTTARTAGLGNAATSGVSTMSGLEALNSNPSNLMLNDGTNALFSHMQYVADINVNTFGIANRIGNNNIAFIVTAWDFGDIPETTESNPEIGSVTFNPTFIQAGVSYARQLTDRISAGATIKVLSEEIDDVNARGIAVDAGMTYLVGETGLRFGVALKNFGPEMTYTGDGLVRQVRIPGQSPNATTNAVAIEAESFELPAVLNFGAAYTAGVAQDIAFTASGNYRSNSFAQDQFAGGLELGFREIFFVRGSYEWQEDMDQTAFDGWSIGAGLVLPVFDNRASFDYSYTGMEFFDDVQFFTVSVTL